MDGNSLIDTVSKYLHVKPVTIQNIILSLTTIVIVMLLRHLMLRIARRSMLPALSHLTQTKSHTSSGH
jgi:hypothetical protein